MAKNKIDVELKVDDKGSLKQTTSSAGKAAKGLNDLGKAGGTADRNLKGASQQSSNSTKNFSKMAQGLEGGLVPAYAELAANIFAVTALFQALKTAADFRVVTESQIAFAGSTGVGIKSLTKDIQSASDSMLSFADASSAASIGIASGLNSGQLTELARGASNVSKILGRDVTDSFNRLVRGVTKAEPELLDELGITLRLTRAKENYATSLGKTASQLTLFEEKQAVNFEVQKQLEEKFNGVADAVDIQGNAIAKLGVAFDKVLNPIKKFTATLGEPVAEFFSKNILSLAAAFGLLIAPVIGRAIPALSDFADAAKDSAKDAAKAFDKAKDAHKDLIESVSSAKDPSKGLRKSLEGIKPTSKGMAAIQSGDMSSLTKNQVRLMRQHAEQGRGIVNKLSADQRKIYIRELKIMEGGFKGFVAKVGKHGDVMKAKFKAQVSSMKAMWAGTMSTMKGAFAKFTKGVDKLMRAMGIIGVMVMMGQLAKDLIANFVSLNGAQEKYARTINDLKGRLEINNEEFSKFLDIQKEIKDANKGTIDSFASLGNMVSSTFRNISGVFTTERISETLKDLTETQNKKANELLAKYDGVTAADFRSVSLDEDANAGSDAQIRARNLKREASNAGVRLSSLQKVLEDLDTSGGTFITKAFGTKEDLANATKEAQSAAKKIVQGLKATGVAATEDGAAFLALNKAIAAGKPLNKEQLDQYNQLGARIEALGQKANTLKQTTSANTAAYTQTIAALTKYKGKHEDLIDSLKKQINLERDTGAFGYEDRIKAAQDKIKVLEALDDIDRKLARKTAIINADFAMNSIGITKGQKGLLDQQRQLDLIKERIAAEKLAIETAGGLKAMDEETQIQKQAAIKTLEAQQKQLRRTMSLNKALADVSKQAFEDTLGSAIEGLIKGTMDVKEAFSSMVQGILSSMAKLMAQRLAVQIIGAMFPVGGTGTGTDINAGGPSIDSLGNVGGDMVARYGGVFNGSGKLPGYATGGIASGPNAGYPVMMHGTEAIVPLPNGKSIPVEMKNSAGQVNNVNVSVQVDSNGNSSVNSDGGGENLGKAIAAAVQEELQNQKRSGGILNPYGAS